MTKPKEVFVEQRKEEGDYAVRVKNSERASKVTKTQEEAIEAAREMFPNTTVLVERVRNTKTGGRDKWRTP